MCGKHLAPRLLPCKHSITVREAKPYLKMLVFMSCFSALYGVLANLGYPHHTEVNSGQWSEEAKRKSIQGPYSTSKWGPRQTVLKGKQGKSQV